MQDESELQRRGKKTQSVAETMTMLDILPPWILYLQLHPDEDQKKHLIRTISAIKEFIDEGQKYLFNNIMVTNAIA